MIMNRNYAIKRISALPEPIYSHIMSAANAEEYKNRLSDLSDCDIASIICLMNCYKHYRIFASDCMYDGESWSANNIYEQAVILSIHKDATDQAIIKALKKARMLPNQLRNANIDIMGEEDYSLYIEYWYSKNREPILLEARRFEEKSLESESMSTYGFTEHRQTKIFIVD